VVLTLATFVESTAAFANIQAAYSGVIGVSVEMQRRLTNCLWLFNKDRYVVGIKSRRAPR